MARPILFPAHGPNLGRQNGGIPALQFGRLPLPASVLTPLVLDYYVDTASAGGDGTTSAVAGATAAYATLAAAVTARCARDLKVDNVVVRIHCAASSGTADTASVAFPSSCVTGQDNYVEIIGEATTSLVFNAAQYRLAWATDSAFDCTYPRHVRLSRLQATHTIGAGATGAVTFYFQGVNGTDNADIRIDRCHIVGVVSAGRTTNVQAVGVYGPSGSQHEATVTNSVIRDYKAAGATHDGIGFNHVAGSFVCYSNTVSNCGVGVQMGTSVTLVSNTGTVGCADGFNGTAASGSTNNASDLVADSPGPNPQDLVTPSFLNAAAGDFHLTSADTAWRYRGFPLWNDATYPFALDGDGAARLPSAANEIRYSEDFTQSLWANYSAGGTSTKDASGVTDPNGGTAAERVTLAGTDAQIDQDATIIAGRSYRVSAYVRSVSGQTNVRFKIYDGSVDTISGDVAISSSWTRVAATLVPPNSSGFMTGNIGLEVGSSLATQTIEVYGFQVEQGSVTGTYVKTVAWDIGADAAGPFLSLSGSVSAAARAAAVASTRVAVGGVSSSQPIAVAAASTRVALAAAARAASVLLGSASTRVALSARSVSAAKLVGAASTRVSVSGVSASQPRASAASSTRVALTAATRAAPVLLASASTRAALAARSVSAGRLAGAASTRVSVSGVSAAQPRASAAGSSRVALVGATRGAPSLLGSVSTRVALAARSASPAWLAGVLGTRAALSGSSAGAARAVAAINIRVPLAGTLAGSASLFGAASTRAALRGSVAGHPLVTAPLATRLALVGTLGAHPRGAGSLATRVSLVGSLGAVGSALGSAGTRVALVGRLGAHPLESAQINLRVPLAGVASAAPVGYGQIALNSNTVVRGTVLANPVLFGRLTTRAALAGASGATGLLAGALGTRFPLSGRAGAHGALAGSLASRVALSGASAAAAVLAGSATTRLALSGVAGAQPTAASDLRTRVRLVGAVLGGAASSGALETRVSLAGQVAVTPLLVGDMQARPDHAYAVMAHPRLYGNLTIRAPRRRLSGTSTVGARIRTI